MLLGLWLNVTCWANPGDFEHTIAPILVRHCLSCHNAGEHAGGLDLSSRQAALAVGDSGRASIVPGRPDLSLLLARLRTGEMPPAEKPVRPTPVEIEHLARWIGDGAVWSNSRVLSVFEFTTPERAGRDWWSLQPVIRPPVPDVGQRSEVRTPIDAFVLERLLQRGLGFSPEADRATLIRRAMLDLLGLPPSPEEVQQFVDDRSADAYERLVERLLASPHYGERWARHWLDVARFGESNGYETNTARPNAWPYRDWLIRALNDDIAFDQFVLEQLAGDQVGVDAATGFLVGGAHDIVASPDIELTMAQRMNDLHDMLTTTASAFLGLTVGCARCHDHKFDPVSQTDYYSLQAVFAGVQHGERVLRWAGPEEQREERDRRRNRLVEERSALERRMMADFVRAQPLAQPAGDGSRPTRPAVSTRFNVERFPSTMARFVKFTILATSQLEPCLDELEVFAADNDRQNLALGSAGAKVTASSVFDEGRNKLHKLEHANDGRYGNAASWVAAEPGTGWLQVELAAPANIHLVVWSRDRQGQFKDRLPVSYRVDISQDGAAWQTVATSQDRAAFDPQALAAPSANGSPPTINDPSPAYRTQLASLSARINALTDPMVYAGTFQQPGPTHLLYRGEPLQPREIVRAGVLAAVPPQVRLAPEAPDAQRRIALAQWITDPANPLPSRVMVNRLWHHHFGHGLVTTPGDLGFHGGRPSHLELLNWLAAEFREGGGRWKPVHRLILLSSTYRQSSRPLPEALAADAEARWLWRFPPRRLDAEAIRDSLLAVAGTLDRRMGGPGYDVFEPNSNYVKVYLPRNSFGPAEWRRMVYQHKPRMRQDATFGEFDCPDASQPISRRNVSTTALQALALLNAPFVAEQSRWFAERLRREAGEDVEGQVARAFWLAFGRAPDIEELAAGRQLVDVAGLPAFCRALLNANELLYLN